jgi:hypothetical protein
MSFLRAGCERNSLLPGRFSLIPVPKLNTKGTTLAPALRASASAGEVRKEDQKALKNREYLSDPRFPCSVFE